MKYIILLTEKYYFLGAVWQQYTICTTYPLTRLVGRRQHAPFSNKGYATHEKCRATISSARRCFAHPNGSPLWKVRILHAATPADVRQWFVEEAKIVGNLCKIFRFFLACSAFTRILGLFIFKSPDCLIGELKVVKAYVGAAHLVEKYKVYTSSVHGNIS